MNRIWILLSLLFLPGWWGIRAQSVERMIFRNMDVPGGDVVVCMAQDNEGMMWIGTIDDGLYCYDGYTCYPCTTVDSLRCSVHNMIAYGDSIYMCTEQGLLIYNRKTHGYRRPPQTLTADARAIVRHGEQFLIGCQQGVFAYTPRRGTIHAVCEQVHHVYSMAFWGNELLVATLNGLYRVKGSEAQEIVVGNRTQEYVSIIVPDRLVKGRYWIGAYGQLFSYEPGEGTFQEVAGLNNSSVKSVAQDLIGRVFVGTDNGLYVLDRAGVARYMHDYLDSRSVANNIIWSSFVDDSGHLWLGTDIGFSQSIAHPDFRYLSVSQLTGSTSGNYLTTLFEDHEGTLWVGGSSGLIRYPRSKDCLWYQMGSPATPIVHNRIRSIYQDSEEEVWICSDYGINHWDRASGRLRNIIVSDSTGRHLARWTYSAVEDETGRLWIGSYDGGVMVVDRQQLLMSTSSLVLAEQNLIPQAHIAQLLVDRQGDIWIRSSKGLFVAHPASLNVTLVSPTKYEAMAMDAAGKIWVAREARLYGYARPDAEPEVVELSTEGEHVVGLMAIDRDLWIWTETEGRVMHPDGSVALFHIPDFKITSAYYAPHRKKICLGGSDAILVMETAYAQQAAGTPLTLSHLQVGGRIIPHKRHESQPIRLPYPENSFTLRLTDLPYLNRQTSVYAYRLVGEDERWHKVDPATMAIGFNALPYGDYHLQVCAMDGRGLPSQVMLEQDIALLPPWYLTLWMKALYLIGGLAFCWLAIHVYRVKRKLKEEQKAKERVVSESQRRICFYRHLYDDILTLLHGVFSSIEEVAARWPAVDKRVLQQVRMDTLSINTLVWDACATISDEIHPMRLAAPINIVSLCQQLVEGAHRNSKSGSRGIVFSSEVIRAMIHADYPGAEMAFSKILRFCQLHRPDGSEVMLHLSTTDRPRQLLVSICIRGLHISEETRPYLLQQYALPQTPHPNETDSTLFQARLWVEQQGGSVYLTPGKEGDSFLLTLPLAEDPLPALQEEEAEDSQKTLPISSASSLPQPTESDERLLREIIQIIDEHMDDRELNVCRLQQLLGIGDKMLYRKVKMMTGMTPVEYIRDIRMKRAAVLLRGGQFSVAEVMYMVGFSNSGYFSKCFQRTFGVTPTNYR